MSHAAWDVFDNDVLFNKNMFIVISSKYTCCWKGTFKIEVLFVFLNEPIFYILFYLHSNCLWSVRLLAFFYFCNYDMPQPFAKFYIIIICVTVSIYCSLPHYIQAIIGVAQGVTLWSSLCQCRVTGSERRSYLAFPTGCHRSSFPHRSRLCPRHGQDTRPIVFSRIYANICRAGFPVLRARKSSWGISTRKQAEGCYSRGHLEQWTWSWLKCIFHLAVSKYGAAV